jgi:biotin carboxyl carrier protein
MKYIVTINNKNYEVEVEQGQATIVGTTEVATGLVRPVAPVKPLSPQVVQPQAVTLTSVAGETIKSPMPGAIIAINVSEGDTVKNGDVLFILEAMKMENEITADQDGIVAKIMVTKGALVATNDVLAVIQY